MRPAPKGHKDKGPDFSVLGDPVGVLSITIMQAKNLREAAQLDVKVDLGHTQRHIRPNFRKCCRKKATTKPKWNKRYVLQLFDEDLHPVDDDKKTLTVSLWKIVKKGKKVTRKGFISKVLHAGVDKIANQKVEEEDVFLGQAQMTVSHILFHSNNKGYLRDWFALNDQRNRNDHSDPYGEIELEMRWRRRRTRWRWRNAVGWGF